MHPSRYPFGELLEDCPVIAAVKSEEGLQQTAALFLFFMEISAASEKLCAVFMTPEKPRWYTPT